MRTTLACFASAAPGSEIRELPGVFVANAAVDVPVFNVACLASAVSEDPNDLDRRLAVAKTYYNLRALPWSFWLCEDLLVTELRGQADNLCAVRGLHQAARCEGMIAEDIEPATHALPSLEFRPVSDAETRRHFSLITAECFRLPVATSMALYDTPVTWHTAFRGWVAYLQGEPIATAATVTSDSAIGLYSVATLPDQRHRSVAETLSRHVLEEARWFRPGLPFVLQSTREGLLLYRRLGFRTATQIVVYTSS